MKTAAYSKKTAYKKPIIYILAVSMMYVKRNTAFSPKDISSKIKKLSDKKGFMSR